MIYWLIQSMSDYPELMQGDVLAGFLSCAEQVRLVSLKTDKRRRDWLLGRLTAKRLVQSYVMRQTGLCIPLAALTIGSDPDGAPRLSAEQPYDLLPALANLRLSISHSGDRAVCALSTDSEIGVDLERIEPRDWQFVEDYFTADEIFQVQLAPAEQWEAVITAIWSAKESALKALHLGLSVDTRSVRCAIAEPDRARDWYDVAFGLDRRLLNLDTAPALAGWWRVANGYALTVAAMANSREQFASLALAPLPEHVVMEI